MPIIGLRAALSGANLMVFSGRVTRDELLQQFGAIDETQDQSSDNWLILDLGYADISDLNFEAFEKLKAILAAKLVVMKARRSFEVAILCLRPFNEPIYQVWKSFVGDDRAYPSDPLLFSDLEAACQRLGYTGAERAELFELCAQLR